MSIMRMMTQLQAQQLQSAMQEKDRMIRTVQTEAIQEVERMKSEKAAAEAAMHNQVALLQSAPNEVDNLKAKLAQLDAGYCNMVTALSGERDHYHQNLVDAQQRHRLT